MANITVNAESVKKFMRRIGLMIVSVLLIGINSVALAEDACEKLVTISLKEALLKKYPDYLLAKATDQRSSDAEWNKYYYNENGS